MLAVLIGWSTGTCRSWCFHMGVAVERLDPILVEAAWDLYASRWAVLTKIILPLIKPGIGCKMVFVPSIGAFITPDLLGGRSMMIGNLIQHEYLVVRDWPLGSAASFVLMAVVMGAVLLHYRQSDSAVGRGEAR
ncbi:MAG: hypothetical protein U0361_05560 [Nitrospiraceae bacterium]